MTRALVLAVLLAGCAEPLSKLVPFPCAKDGTCPGGLACVPGVGCAAPSVDALCDGTTDCASGGLSCQLGLCTRSCDGACGDGRVCSGPDAGTCISDCSAGEACPSGLTCRSLWYGGRKGCLPSTVSVAACAGVDAEAAPVCGAESFTVSCANGRICGAHSVCTGDTSCECEAGYLSWQCQTGERCTTADCAYPNWWCLPVGIDGACATSGGYAPGTWRCVDGRHLRAVCGSDCETACQATASACDPVAQDCAQPGATKCTVLTTDAGVVDTTCVAEDGTVATGGSCTRDATAAFAKDDCARGALCSELATPGAPSCLRFCRHTSDCAGAACMQVTDRVPPDGVCVAQCTLFAPCADGRACGPEHDLDARAVAQCRDQVPSAVEGTACTDQSDCAADLLCVTGSGGGATCRPLCDPAHPCAGGGSCAVLSRSELPAGTGYCP